MKKRKYVIPGDVVAEGDYSPGPNTYRDGERILATKVGIAEIEDNRVHVVPVKGKYIPRQGDTVVGVIVDYNVLSWTVDINSIFYAYLLAKEVLRKGSLEKMAENKLEVGDAIVARVLAFDLSRDPLLTLRGPGLGRVSDGELVRVSPSSIYRLIDRRERLNKMIEEATGCKLTVGMNGVIVIEGSPEGTSLAIRAIRLVESEDRPDVLTKSIKSMFDMGG